MNVRTFLNQLKFSGNLVKRKIIHPLSKPTPHLVTFNFPSLQVKNMCQIVQKSFNKRHSFNTLFFQKPQIMSSFSSPKPSSDLFPCGGGIYSYSEQIELQKYKNYRCGQITSRTRSQLPNGEHTNSRICIVKNGPKGFF